MAQPKPENKVDVESVQFTHMKDCGNWDLIAALLGGTQAMRDAGEQWLPRETREDPGSHAIRLNRSFLYNGFEDTVGKLAGKPFAKAVTNKGTLPNQLQEVWDDVDRTNRDITQFSKELLEEGVTWGITHVLVDYPKVPAGGTLEDERKLGARPTFVHVKPTDLIGWRSETLVNGEEKLTMIRFKECKVENAGTYGDTEVERIRVFTKDTWEVWEKQQRKTRSGIVEDYFLIENGTHTFGEVPLVTLYIGKRTGFMTAEPPLKNLAWLNLCHWQSSSDQRAILRFARVGILFGSGFSEEEVENGIVIGPSKLVASSNPNAKLAYVEHNGEAIGAGEKDLETLQAQMEVLGLAPLLEKAGDSTATGRIIDKHDSNSDMQQWVRALEDMLNGCFTMAAQWLKVELPSDFSVDIFDEFNLAVKSVSDLDTLTKARQAGDLDRTTYLNEIKRRGVLAESVNPADVSAAIESEGPPLGLVPPVVKPPVKNG